MAILMKLIDKYNCVLCKYNKYNKTDDCCFNHMREDEHWYHTCECKSLSNIYYGTIIKLPLFKQIHSFLYERAWGKEEKYNNDMDEKYSDSSLETDDIKFIWGIVSYDDLSGSNANLYTMNNIDITYDKKDKKYMLGVETAYIFDTYNDECEYLRQCLSAFTKYMDENGLVKNKKYKLFMSDPYTRNTADTIEELYTNFKIFVDGYCNLDIDMDCE